MKARKKQEEIEDAKWRVEIDVSRVAVVQMPGPREDEEEIPRHLARQGAARREQRPDDAQHRYAGQHHEHPGMGIGTRESPQPPSARRGSGRLAWEEVARGFRRRFLILHYP